MYYANLGHGMGSEQEGRRPVLIIQNDVGNKYSSTVIVAAISSKGEDKKMLPTHFAIDAGQGLKVRSMALLEQIRTIDKNRLEDRVGKLTPEKIRELNRALAVSVGLVEPRSKEMIPGWHLLCVQSGADAPASFHRHRNTVSRPGIARDTCRRSSGKFQPKRRAGRSQGSFCSTHQQ